MSDYTKTEKAIINGRALEVTTKMWQDESGNRGGYLLATDIKGDEVSFVTVGDIDGNGIAFLLHFSKAEIAFYNNL